MIIADRKDFKRYNKLNKHFETVNKFLENTDLKALPTGRVEIDGDNVFGNCMEFVAVDEPGKLFENHKEYLDIHVVISNQEQVAVSSFEGATLAKDYDEKDDYSLFTTTDYQLITLTPLNLLVVYEEDLHQPKIRCNDEPVKKIVLKVLKD